MNIRKNQNISLFQKNNVKHVLTNIWKVLHRSFTHCCVLIEGGINYKFSIGIKNQVQKGLYQEGAYD